MDKDYSNRFFLGNNKTLLSRLAESNVQSRLHRVTSKLDSLNLTGGSEVSIIGKAIYFWKSRIESSVELGISTLFLKQ